MAQEKGIRARHVDGLGLGAGHRSGSRSKERVRIDILQQWEVWGAPEIGVPKGPRHSWETAESALLGCADEDKGRGVRTFLSWFSVSGAVGWGRGSPQHWALSPPSVVGLALCPVFIISSIYIWNVLQWEPSTDFYSSATPGQFYPRFPQENVLEVFIFTTMWRTVDQAQ